MTGLHVNINVFSGDSGGADNYCIGLNIYSIVGAGDMTGLQIYSNVLAGDRHWKILPKNRPGATG